MNSWARITALIAILFGSIFASGTAVSEEVAYFRIGTGGIAGTYYPIGGLAARDRWIAQWISNPPGSRPCDKGGSCGVPGLVSVAQAANGSVANVIGVGQGDLESGFAQSDVAYWAYSGTGIFSKKESIDNLRVIGSLYAESFHLVVKPSSKTSRRSTSATRPGTKPSTRAMAASSAAAVPPSTSPAPNGTATRTSTGAARRCASNASARSSRPARAASK